MDNPLFSIITVTYNAEKVLTPTLESVKCQLCKNYELIVIDGKSSDNTINIARNAKIENISITSEPDKGIYDAMNKGIRQAKGKYLLFLNAGDALHNENTLYSLSELLKTEDADIIYGDTILVNEERKAMRMRDLSAPKKLTVNSFRRGMLVCHQSFLVKRDIAPEYDLKYRFSSDYDWCIKCLKKSKLNLASGEIISQFLKGGATDKNHKASLIERFKIMCNHYGTISTVIMHILFIPRYLFNKYRPDDLQTQS